VDRPITLKSITMIDMASINAAIASVNAIATLVKNTKDLQLDSEVSNLLGKLIAVQQQALALQKENQDLSDEIKRMRRAAEDENSFQFMHGDYWKTSDVVTLEEDENGNRITAVRWDGPFCPLCKDADNKAVRLKRTGQTGPRPGSLEWICEIHKTDYEAPMM
jgi:hypothetical protein